MSNVARRLMRSLLNSAPLSWVRRSQASWPLLLCVICLSVASPGLVIPSYAQISVDNVIIRFSAGQRPVQNVNVRNNSPKVAYVNVEAHSVPSPGTSQSLEKTSDLIVSPRAFSIEPNGTRTVRILLQTPPTELERTFRVSFIPQDRDFGEEHHFKTEGRAAVIRVLSGMGILVFADPAKPIVDLAWKRLGNKLVLYNAGNVNIYIADGQSCPPNTNQKLAPNDATVSDLVKASEEQKSNCSRLETKRLYAGQRVELTTPGGNSVTYLRSDGGTAEYQRLVIPAGDGGQGVVPPVGASTPKVSGAAAERNADEGE